MLRQSQYPAARVASLFLVPITKWQGLSMKEVATADLPRSDPATEIKA